VKKYLLKSGLLAGICSLMLASSASALGVASSAADGTKSSSTARSGAQLKLQADKLKLCQAREKLINNTMDRVSKRGQKHVDDITKLTTRVENFYSKSGKTLSNYDGLVSDVNAKKVAAQAAVDKVKADQAGFKCDGNDPKGVASAFKDDVEAMETANKGYRTSAKNLIVGVRSALKGSSDTSTGGAQ
jgi:hypothetical protein